MARPSSLAASSRPRMSIGLGPICLLALAVACGSDAEDSSDATSQASSSSREPLAPASTATSAPSPVQPAVSAPAASAASSPPAPPPANAAGAAPGNAAGSLDPEPAAPTQPAQLFAACTYSEGAYGRNCDSLFVTMKQTSPAQCVQLTLDNCAEYGNRPGLGVRMPMPWRLDSGTVSSNLNECELGVFYPSSNVAQRASGSVRWNETTRLPSEIALEVTLETSSAEADNANVQLVTTAPIATTVCDE